MLRDYAQSIPTDKMEECDTIFYQGNSQSQTQILKYTGNRMVKASTGEFMWCDGRNNLKPLNVIYRPYIGPEIADVNLKLFNTWSSHFNPLNWVDQFWSYGSACYYNYHFISSPQESNATIRFHGLNRDKSSIGQETDIDSHRDKVESWRKESHRSKKLILWGVSRGTATTFCSMARDKFPEVKLIILEGAIDSIENIKSNIEKKAYHFFCQSKNLSKALCYIPKEVYFPHRYRAYKATGPSPLKSVEDFPENIPVVFITSEADTLVPCANTENIAYALAKQRKNDVFLLKLKHSSHPNYMFDNKEDRDTYEQFIHAVYKRYNIKHDAMLADKGETLLTKSILNQKDLSTLSLGMK